MIQNLEQIKMRANIIDFVQEKLVLRKQASTYFGLCPFHSEKSGSFAVSESRQYYKCFGCDASGDVFAFVQHTQNISFFEAVEYVAEKVGLEVISEKRAKLYDKKDLQNRLENLARAWHNALKKQEKLLSYLQKRGVSLEHIEHFCLGFCDNRAQNHFLTKQEQESLGLLNKKGGAFFAHRIIFPVRNGIHKIVGFAARTHPYFNFRNSPKYLNSKESFLFKKSDNLYLLSEAKSAAKNAGAMVIVEGYMDAISAHILGIKNCVATCGTAFNINHLSALIRLNDTLRVIFLLDNDSAGVSATFRAVSLCLANKVYEGEVWILQGAKDLNELLENNLSLEAHRKSLSLLTFYAQYLYKHAKSIKDKDNIIKNCQSFVANEQNYFSRDFLAQGFSEALKIDKSYFFSTKISHKQPNNERLSRFIASILQDKECKFIAQEALDVQALEVLENKSLALALKSYLKSDCLSEALQGYLFFEPLDSKSFFSYVCDMHFDYYQSKLTQAKTQKDTRAILFYTQKLADVKKDATTQSLF